MAVRIGTRWSSASRCECIFGRPGRMRNRLHRSRYPRLTAPPYREHPFPPATCTASEPSPFACTPPSILQVPTAAGVSDAVLEAVARALQLDDAEREHLFDLARSAGGAAQPVRKRRSKKWSARDSLVRALDAVAYGPAFVRDRKST